MRRWAWGSHVGIPSVKESKRMGHMGERPLGHGYRIYWIVWGILLIVTLGMAVVGTTALTTFLILVLLLGMLVKASLITGYFMHLRFERTSLILAVAVGLLVTAGVLFFLIAPDGLRVLNSRSPAGDLHIGGGR